MRGRSAAQAAFPMPLSSPQNPETGPNPSRTLTWLRLFKPARVRINQRERWRMVLGMVLCIVVVALFAHWLGMASSPPWMVASLGASAVLIIALPSSPLAQPWPVLAGSVLSYLVGVACTALVPHLSVASGLAVGLAVVVMLALRCLHPPGGATALIAVIGGDSVHQLGYLYVLVPAALGASVMLVIALLVNNIPKTRKYPEFWF